MTRFGGRGSCPEMPPGPSPVRGYTALWIGWVHLTTETEPGGIAVTTEGKGSKVSAS
jgi:hypothetical protein